ncbi:tRNA (cytosine-5-)-methyltransferase ncl1 [Hanseniaspora vineae]
MSRGGNKGKGRNNRGKKTFGQRDDANNRNWVATVKENAKWETFYKQQGFIPEEEWDTFKKTCQAQLPLTFRITGSRKQSKEVLHLFEEKFLPNLSNLTHEDVKLEAPFALPWYPDHLGWQLDASKSVIRKNEQFAKFQRFLVLENSIGNISRQEAVSMIPPMFLDVEPHHRVLDMCAAPGSKTAQLLESLHKTTAEPTGFVIANDADFRRSHMLVHQLKRLNSPNLLVVNHDAQFFPRIAMKWENDKKTEFIKFDRVLCDVPCSGDGTMRKNINVWKDWNAQGGLGLHTIQLNILMRGLKLLQNNGRLVYSTCSLNPMENEAVIAQALRLFNNDPFNIKHNQRIRLVDCKDKLKGLKRAPGVSDWKVFDRNMELQNEFNAENPKMKKSYFPPTQEEKEEFQLQHCVRVYQHMQNTGGFFITLIEKYNPQETETAEEKEAEEEKLPRDANEEPFNFINPNHPELTKCWKFYGIDDKFDKRNCLVRNATGEPSRTIYTVSSDLRNIIENNTDRLKLIYSGIKLFVAQRSDIECNWRIQSESLPIVRNHIANNNRIFEVTNPEFLKTLMTISFPNFEELSKHDATIAQQIKDASTGCAFLLFNRQDENLENLFLPIWNGSKCCNLMISKEDTHELLFRVFGIETTNKDLKVGQDDGSAAKKANEEKKAAAAAAATTATFG